MAKTGYETFGDQKPLEHHIQLPMVADSSAETGIEIDTGLAPGMKLGWTMVGVDWSYRLLASPHTVVVEIPTADISASLQLCRGDMPATPLLLHPKDEHLIYDMSHSIWTDTSVGGALDEDSWHRIRKPARTQKSKLYLQYATDADWTLMSVGSIIVFAVLYYYLVNAPEIHGHKE